MRLLSGKTLHDKTGIWITGDNHRATDAAIYRTRVVAQIQTLNPIFTMT